MRIKFCSLVFLALTCLFAISSCYHEKKYSQLLEENLTDELVKKIQKAKEIRFYKVLPTFHNEYTIEKEFVLLDALTTQKLKSILLDEGSYIFDVDKRCLFFPEYAFKLDDEEETLLLMDISCKQLSIPYVLNDRKLNIDPSAEHIARLIDKN